MHSDQFSVRFTERASGWLSEHAPNRPPQQTPHRTTGGNRTHSPIEEMVARSRDEDTVWLPSVINGPRQEPAHRPTDPKTLVTEPSVSRRLATRYDHDLLRAIFTECASFSFATLPITLAAALLDSQYRAHRTDRQQNWPDSVDQIIELRGVPAGRLTVVVRGSELRILDLGLLTGFRGQGVGSAVLTDLIGDATEYGLSVHGALAKGNRSLALYLRCGLEVVAESDTYFEMARAC